VTGDDVTSTKLASPVEAGTYEAYMHDCPAVALLSTISNRWVSLTMCTLGSNGAAMRYSHVSREIPGVSQKMLTQTLRMLERDGMVSRTVTPTVPIRVDYELTPLGQGLYGLLSQVRDWAGDKAGEVDDARARYDSRHADQYGQETKTVAAH
jgi:DNA-binding HxlR family transcriptional regulator